MLVSAEGKEYLKELSDLKSLSEEVKKNIDYACSQMKSLRFIGDSDEEGKNLKKSINKIIDDNVVCMVNLLNYAKKKIKSLERERECNFGDSGIFVNIIEGGDRSFSYE